MIIDNLVNMPLLAWRVLIGPLHPEIAAFESFTINIVYSWNFVTLLQVSHRVVDTEVS